MARVVHYLPKRIPAAFKAALAADVAAGKDVVIVRPKVVRL